jgi:hypothetical protein
MGRTLYTEPQCLYSRAIPLLSQWAVRSIQCLSACTVELYLYSPNGPYAVYRASVPVQKCTLPFLPHKTIKYSGTNSLSFTKEYSTNKPMERHVADTSCSLLPRSFQWLHRWPAHPAIQSHSHIVSQQHHQITLSAQFNKAHTELKNAARNGTSL